VTPWTGPWRIIACGPTRESVFKSAAVQSLQR
jgi:hypothetical protein